MRLFWGVLRPVVEASQIPTISTLISSYYNWIDKMKSDAREKSEMLGVCEVQIFFNKRFFHFRLSDPF